MSIESVIPSNHLIICHPLLLLPSLLSSIRVFSKESFVHTRQPNIGASPSESVLSMNIPDEFPLGMTGFISLPSKGHSRVSSNTKGTLKSVLQHHSSKASILWHSATFMVQPSHPYMTTGKTIAFTRWTFVGKVMSLLFNMLFILDIAFLPRSKHILISWLLSLSTVILEPKKIKFVYFLFPHLYATK